MSQRDYRTRANIDFSEGKGNPILGIISKAYTRQSHVKIMSHAKNSEKLNAKILSIGNITFGGSGKTPHVEFFAGLLSASFKQIGIATSGYKGMNRNRGMLVSDGSKTAADVRLSGDEALLLGQSLLQYKIPVYAHRNRIDAAKELIKDFNCDLIILDDAFHFVSLARDVDLLLIDALNPFGAGRKLKPGLLREPVDSVNRADAVIITHSDLPDLSFVSDLTEFIRKSGFKGPFFKSCYVPACFYDASGIEIPKETIMSMKLIPMSGIGNPVSFEKSLDKIGITNPNPIRFNDHQQYSRREMELMNTAIDMDKADGIIITQKDLVKLHDWVSQIKGKVIVLHSAIQIESECINWTDNKLGLELKKD